MVRGNKYREGNQEEIVPLSRAKKPKTNGSKKESKYELLFGGKGKKIKVTTASASETIVSARDTINRSPTVSSTGVGGKVASTLVTLAAMSATKRLKGRLQRGQRKRPFPCPLMGKVTWRRP